MSKLFQFQSLAIHTLRFDNKCELLNLNPGMFRYQFNGPEASDVTHQKSVMNT